MDKKVIRGKYLFILVLLLNASKLFGQRIVVTDSLFENRSEYTFIIGETHPSRVWQFYKHDSSVVNLIANYSLYKKQITSALKEKSNLQQVVLEYPVFMEYNILKYRETGDSNWLNCIKLYPFVKKEAVEYLDFLIDSAIDIRCIDLPRKNQLQYLKLSLLNILLEPNGLQCILDAENFIYIDTVYDDINATNSDSCNGIFLGDLCVESLRFFSEEIELLVNSISKNGKLRNKRVFDYLQKRLDEDSLLLSHRLSHFDLYKRVLNSLEGYLNYTESSGWHKYQYREVFLSSQFIYVNKPNQLVIIGNSHVHNMNPLIYERRRGYMNFYDLISDELTVIIPSVTYFERINSDRTLYSMEWESDMRLVFRQSTDEFLISVFRDDLNNIRIVTHIR